PKIKRLGLGQARPGRTGRLGRPTNSPTCKESNACQFECYSALIVKNPENMVFTKAGAGLRGARGIGEPKQAARSCPIGAEVLASGGVRFRLWAPKQKRVQVELSIDIELSSRQEFTIWHESRAAIFRA